MSGGTDVWWGGRGVLYVHQLDRVSPTSRRSVFRPPHLPASLPNMLANFARAAARPSLGLVRRAAATTKCPTATATAVSLPRNLRCASTLGEVLKAEIKEEKLVAFDEGEG